MSVEAVGTIQAVSTVILVLVTAVYVVLTNRLTKTAKQSLELAVLPRLSIQKGRAHINSGGCLEVEVILENVGHGAAVDVRLQAAISSVDPGSSPDFETDPKEKYEGIAAVAPGMRSPAAGQEGLPQPTMHSIIFSGDDIDEDIQAVVGSNSKMKRVFAVVRFSSVTGTRFETRKSEAGIGATQKLREPQSHRGARPWRSRSS